MNRKKKKFAITKTFCKLSFTDRKSDYLEMLTAV